MKLTVRTNLRAGASMDNLTTVDCSRVPCKNWYGVPITRGIYTAYNCSAYNTDCWDMNGKHLRNTWVVDPMYNLQQNPPIYAYQ